MSYGNYLYGVDGCSSSTLLGWNLDCQYLNVRTELYGQF